MGLPSNWRRAPRCPARTPAWHRALAGDRVAGSARHFRDTASLDRSAVSLARAAPPSLVRADFMEEFPGSGSGPSATKGVQPCLGQRRLRADQRASPDQQYSAAGKQHDYAAAKMRCQAGRDRLPPPRGEAEVMPAGAKPRPGQWAVRALIKASILEHRLQIARLGCGDDASRKATAGAVASDQAARDACQTGQLRRRLLDHGGVRRRSRPTKACTRPRSCWSTWRRRTRWR